MRLNLVWGEGSENHSVSSWNKWVSIIGWMGS